MPSRLQPRRVARELALLSISQIKASPEKLEQQEINDLVLAAIRTLIGEIHETLETAAGEVTRGNEQLLKSETRATSPDSARAMVKESLELSQKAINRLAIATELPELIQLSSQYEVREYALELIGTVNRKSQEIDSKIEAALFDWQLSRLPKIDRDILRIAVAEMLFLDFADRVAINEAVELAKRYSDEDGFRFINGVLRRVSDGLKAQAKQSS
ncbi:transcription antitermination protein NusB [Candidatus Gracilibacteria bacterium]|jgi:transcription antitermination protein NusB|nr:transcription antitermination protein NusB [Candidatus Gracilibacteria bacterium]NJM87734.1 transcription antitermination protein NusB [Hydrococcus sp. RU_2_2]NJP18708.1 transcription antitermination protein NusB [Hydrococcus sp. CRU_1_1]NJQ97451.1 transcription antitermination protein NusB [Hydrococcus sp. CSU_1_8]